MEREKKPEFVVTDRRKFNVDGEPRSDAPQPEPLAPAPAAEPAPAPAEPSAAQAAPGASQPAAKPAAAKGAPAASSAPPPETGYNGETQRSTFGGQKMEFIHLLDMLVQTAMMYAGAMESGAERRVDVVGLRQMIDLIGVLEEKTRGNLTEQEAGLLKNTIFQLRMTYMEIVKMIEQQAMQKAPGAPGSGHK